MATPLQKNINIRIDRKKSDADFEMTVINAAADHYSIGYMVSGDRKEISPAGTYYYHENDVVLMSPFTYHKTLFSSEAPYERILIKFSPNFAEPFIQNVGQQIFDQLYQNRVFYFHENVSEKIKAMFIDMETEYNKEIPYKEFILQGMLCRLLANVWEYGISRQHNAIRNKLTMPVINAIAYMENFYNKNPSLKETAKEIGLSPAYFSRLFTHELGKSYSEYLSEIKLRHVIFLLTHTDKTIMEIAQETGYCHGNYLSNQFRQKIGMTPAHFRKNS